MSITICGTTINRIGKAEGKVDGVGTVFFENVAQEEFGLEDLVAAISGGELEEKDQEVWFYGVFIPHDGGCLRRIYQLMNLWTQYLEVNLCHNRYHLLLHNR